MGLLFSKKTRSTNNYSLRNEYTSLSTNSDDRVGADNGAIVTRGNVNILDGGAVAGSLNLARDITAGAYDSLGTIAELSSGTFDSALDAVTGQADRVLTMAQAERLKNVEMQQEQSGLLTEKLFNIALPLGIVFAIAWAVKK